LYKIIKDTKNRTSFLGAILYENGLFSYIILTEGLVNGNLIYSGSYLTVKQNLKKGFALPLYLINLFTIVNNIELNPYKGASLSRAAGAGSLIVGRKSKRIIIKLKSNWLLYLNKNCIATIGNVSNILYKFFNYKKAGNIIKLGKRPSVRGVAMNPCDHPHGGGEGKKSPPSTARSPWGWFTSGGRPSKNKKYELLFKKKFKKLR